MPPTDSAPWCRRSTCPDTLLRRWPPTPRSLATPSTRTRCSAISTRGCLLRSPSPGRCSARSPTWCPDPSCTSAVTRLSACPRSGTRHSSPRPSSTCTASDGGWSPGRRRPAPAVSLPQMSPSCGSRRRTPSTPRPSRPIPPLSITPRSTWLQRRSRWLPVIWTGRTLPAPRCRSPPPHRCTWTAAMPMRVRTRHSSRGGTGSAFLATSPSRSVCWTGGTRSTTPPSTCRVRRLPVARQHSGRRPSRASTTSPSCCCPGWFWWPNGSGRLPSLAWRSPGSGWLRTRTSGPGSVCANGSARPCPDRRTHPRRSTLPATEALLGHRGILFLPPCHRSASVAAGVGGRGGGGRWPRGQGPFGDPGSAARQQGVAPGDHHRVGPVPGAELGDQVGHMAPHRLHPDHQLGGDLSVGEPLGNQSQDLQLPVAGLRAGPGGRRGCGEQLAHLLREDQALPGRDGAHSVDHLLGGAALEQEPGRSYAQGGLHVVVVAERGQHQDRRRVVTAQ